MQTTPEITALFSLMDDPDEAVYQIVADKIVTYGDTILPYLEDHWEATSNQFVHSRIQELMHQVHFNLLAKEFAHWSLKGNHDLLHGTTYIARLLYPNLQTTTVQEAVEKIKKNIWLELNDSHTSLEKANIVSNMLFNFQEIKCEKSNYQNIDKFFLHHLLENKIGNTLSTAILYQSVCEKLRVHVKLINIPDQSILACFQKNYKAQLNKVANRDLILFYVDANTGNLFSQADLDIYFELYNISAPDSYFSPLTHKQIIQKLLKELGKCFAKQHLPKRKKEIEMLSSILMREKMG